MHVSGLGLASELMVLTLSGSTVEEHDGHLVVRTSSNPTFWWGNFFVLPAPVQPGSGEAWLERFAEAFPEAAHRTFAIDGAGEDITAADELVRVGLEVDRETVLTAPAGSLVAPSSSAADPGAVRALTGDDDWAQALSLRLAGDDMATTPEHRTYLTHKVRDERAMTEAGHGARFGAFVDHQLVAALSIVSDGHGLARYQVVETRPEHRRRGHARALLHHASDHAAAHLDARTLVILADPGYHAIDLYRSAGFTDTEKHVQVQQPTS